MTTTLEQRIAQLEKDMAEVKAALALDKDRAWESTLGVFKDDPVYDEVVRLGRNWRRRQSKNGGFDARPGHGPSVGARPTNRRRRRAGSETESG